MSDDPSSITLGPGAMQNWSDLGAGTDAAASPLTRAYLASFLDDVASCVVVGPHGADVVAQIAAPIDGSRETCRAKECEMGDLVADAMLERVRDQGVSIAIQNGGGLRASIDAGPVTMGEVYSVLPFQNTLATFQAKGSTILAALENGASQYEEAAGRFAQVAGLKYTLDPNAAAGSRISDVQVRDGETWAPIDPEATYKVVTNNYMRGGGDGYRMFESDGMNAYDFGPDLADVLRDALPSSASPSAKRAAEALRETYRSGAPPSALALGADLPRRSADPDLARIHW